MVYFREEVLQALDDFGMRQGVKVKMCNGIDIQLPLGFHFRPTEDQLVINYLLPKVLNQQLPNYFVDEIENPFGRSPLQLTGGPEKDYEYFFSKQNKDFLKKYYTHNGCWILVCTKRLLAEDGDEVVEACRAKYLFFDSNHEFSGWRMCVYSLLDFRILSKARVMNNVDNWVVLRIFHQNAELPQYFKYIYDEDDEEKEELKLDEDYEQVSSSSPEDYTTELQQVDLDSQTDAEDVTPTSSCSSVGEFDRRLL